MPWDPSKHPRDALGRFTRKTTPGSIVLGGLVLGGLMLLLVAYGYLQLNGARSDTPSPRSSVPETIAPGRLGRDLRADREFVGRTIEDAARQARIPAERLVAIEGGVGPAPTVDELRRLARVYALPQDLQEKRMADAGHVPGR